MLFVLQLIVGWRTIDRLGGLLILSSSLFIFNDFGYILMGSNAFEFRYVSKNLWLWFWEWSNERGDFLVGI